jgi:hypothetical protein
MGKNRTAIAWFLSGRGFGALSSDGGDLQKYDWTDAHGEVRGTMGLANQRCVWRSLVWAGSWIDVEFRTVNRGGFVLRACDCKMLTTLSSPSHARCLPASNKCVIPLCCEVLLAVHSGQLIDSIAIADAVNDAYTRALSSDGNLGCDGGCGAVGRLVLRDRSGVSVNGTCGRGSRAEGPPVPTFHGT